MACRGPRRPDRRLVKRGRVRSLLRLAATLRRPCVARGASPRAHRRALQDRHAARGGPAGRRALHRPALPVPRSLHERTLLVRAWPRPAARSALCRLVLAARSVRRAAERVDVAAGFRCGLGAAEQLRAPDGVVAASRRAAPAGMCTASLSTATVSASFTVAECMRRVRRMHVLRVRQWDPFGMLSLRFYRASRATER